MCSRPVTSKREFAVRSAPNSNFMQLRTGCREISETAKPGFGLPGLLFLCRGTHFAIGPNREPRFGSRNGRKTANDGLTHDRFPGRCDKNGYQKVSF